MPRCALALRARNEASKSARAAKETAIDLRARLLANLHNVELRQKYLAVRTPEWLRADLRRALRCLVAWRLLRVVLGYALLGASGALVGEGLLGQGGGALPILVGLGSALSGALVFGALAARGDVVFPEIVGEVSEPQPGQGGPTLLGRVWERLLDTACGALWGLVCGLLVGPAVWLADVVFGLRGNVLAGTVGGSLLGLGFVPLLLVLGRSGAVALARWWAELGPLPVWAYFGSRPSSSASSFSSSLS